MGTKNVYSFYLWPMSHAIFFLNTGPQTEMIIILKLLQNLGLKLIIWRESKNIYRLNYYFYDFNVVWSWTNVVTSK